MFGGSDFDAALVGNPRGESPFLDGNEFRPAYCVFTGRSPDSCTDTTHENENR
jgi:hypothetical protein